MWGVPVDHDVTVLIGGKAGEGINSAGMLVAHLLNHLGYHTFMYYDYPSLIRGGHNFAYVRGAERQIGVHREFPTYVIALDQQTIAQHRQRFTNRTVIISDSGFVHDGGQGISVKTVLEQEKASPIMGNSALIGGFAKAAGIPWQVVEEVFTRHLARAMEANLRVARRGYDLAAEVRRTPALAGAPRALIMGNEAIGLGLVAGGITAYVSYPMTPSSSLLHFLAENADRFGLTVVHPENEIAVMLMALGFAYAGRKAAVGTSGGGFCLMTEGLSLAGMAEIPIVLVVSQRTGPSTGLPTYTGQSDLHFVLHAGQGEFPRFVASPGDAGEALFWSAAAVGIAWKYQVPAFILADKTLSEGMYSLDPPDIPESAEISRWNGVDPYLRYALDSTGVSPLAFPGTKGAVVKVDSYAHDPAGITTEDPEIVARMAEKRWRKGESLAAGITGLPTVITSGDLSSSTTLICWGSLKGACGESSEALGWRMVRPVVLSPFPVEAVTTALRGTRRLIAVEENSTGQLALLLRRYGIVPDTMILQEDGRPFTPDALVARLKEAVP